MLISQKRGKIKTATMADTNTNRYERACCFKFGRLPLYWQATDYLPKI